MICVNCFHEKTNIVNSRPQKKSPVTWRRHHCLQCGTIFTTYERPSLEDQLVLNANGSHSPFSIGKLTSSISRAFQHNKHAADFDSYPLALSIQDTLLINHRNISVDDIAAVTHHIIRNYDKLAAIQYAAQHNLITLRRRPGRPDATSSALHHAPDHS